MPLKTKKQTFKTKFQLLQKKPGIFFGQYFKPALREFLVNLTNHPFLVAGTLLSPLFIYLNVTPTWNLHQFIPLINQNLPGSIVPTQKVSWETFQKTQYLPKGQSIQSRFLKSTINRMEYWSDLLTFEVTDKWESYKKNYFLGTGYFDRKPIFFQARDNHLSRFYSLSNPFQNRDYLLDEFPLKLQSHGLNEPPYQLNPTKQKMFKGIDLKDSKLIPLKKTPSLYIGIQNQIDSKKIKVKELSQSVLKTAFYDAGYIFENSKFDLDSEFESKWSHVSAHEILEILNDQLNTTPTLDSPRLMSGFRYPDMTQDDLDLLEKQTKYRMPFGIRNKLSIFLGNHFSNPSIYSAVKPDPVNLKLTYYPIVFDDEGDILYSGPGVKTKGTRFESPNWFEVKENLQALFDKDDPSHFLKKVFFTNHLITERDSEMANRCVVPFLSSSDLDTWLSKRDEFALEAFPIRSISLLKHQNETNLDRLDYQFMGPFLKGAIEYDPPMNQSPFNFTTVSDASYINPGGTQVFEKSDASLPFQFQAQVEKVLKVDLTKSIQLWEPIHRNSWLIIIQYGLAVFIFYVLRQFTSSYGKELISYLIDVISALGILDASFKEELTSDDSRYRIIRQPKLRFKNVAGVDPIFSQLSELVWFLRTSQSFQKVPKGILLVGPPGSGKTLLVQAIAGEAQIPIFLQPAGAFSNLEGLGAQRLQRLFEKAQEIAPCIIFFDEIDSIGQRRSHIIQNSAGSYSLFDLVSNSVKPIQNNRLEMVSDEMNEKKRENDSLSLLMQLLIELDGLQSKKKVIVMGATNRIEALDPALIRPGRFDKILKLGFPKKEKRIQICQLYAKILGMESSIYWDYIGNRTVGLSGADLATIMNQSCIDAILQGTKHSMETIETAIDKIVGSGFNPYLATPETPTRLSRLAYYNTGIAFLQLALPELDAPISCSLIPTRPNSRYAKLMQTRQNKLTRLTRTEIKAEITSLFGGKLCEFLYFKKTPNYHFMHSDFGNRDLLKATNLLYQLQESSSFGDPSSFSSVSSSEEDFGSNSYHFQRWSKKSDWQISVSKESYINLNYSNWYRIYLKNPDEMLGNEEWVAPDYYSHENLLASFFLTKTLGYFSDWPSRSILDQMDFFMNEALLHFSGNFEFVDFFACSLIQRKYLRRFEIQYLWSQFHQCT